MVPDEPAKPPETKPERPPIPDERRISVYCQTCNWNAWVSVPTPVRELHFDVEETSGEVRGTPFNLIVCAGCGTRLILGRDEQGHLVPSFDQPRKPLYGDVLSGRVTVSER